MIVYIGKRKKKRKKKAGEVHLHSENIIMALWMDRFSE
jgi:hypothetical protein